MTTQNFKSLRQLLLTPLKILSLLLILISSAALASGGNSQWRQWNILKDSWSASDERSYSEFVSKLGGSGCNTVNDCLHSSANFLANDQERATVNWVGDCGRFPYIMRAYFAWKNHLPFGQVTDVAALDGSTDLRYSESGNTVIARSSVIQTDPNSPVDGVEKVHEIVDDVFTAMYRYNPANDAPSSELFFDFYSPSITRDQIRPGSVIYDPNGHVVLIYKIEDDGRIRYFDAHPDNTVSHGVYGEKFVRSSPGMGAGFKNFRPLKLVNYRELPDGRLIGGRLVAVSGSEIPGYSLEQFYGTNPGSGAWSNGTFMVNGQVLDYYDFVRTRLAVGELKYHPVEEMTNGMDALCQDIKDRAQAVNGAIKVGLDRKSHPLNLPKNIYGTDGDWEEYSSPSRDARLKTSFKELRDHVEQFIQMYNNHSDRVVYTGSNLLADLRAAYRLHAQSCTFNYRRSDGRAQQLNYEDVVQRLFALSFDPYNCIERRWGASSSEELSSCADDNNKIAWYQAEQPLRNQLDRAYAVIMGFSLQDLLVRAPGSGVSTPPDVDLKSFLSR